MMNDNKTKIYWIDLFCGAGGTSTGIHLANDNISVIACVNHDIKAIESHYENHPDCKHFTEDIRDFNVVIKLKKIVDQLRRRDTDCVINIWASLECTNYSKAKGGLPRDGDSRTLANHLYMYLEYLQPNYLYIENVREFMAWGPLDEKGKPISRKNGRDYIKWIEAVKSFGYTYDWKLLNAADFGAYTSRQRYFGIFALNGFPISFPEPTHYDTRKKKFDNGMFEFTKKPWKAVKEVLHLEKEGQSIFTRKKPLSENTLKRIYAGLIKFVAGGETEFTKVYNSGNDLNRVKSINEPLGSLTTQNSHAVVSTKFLYHNHGGDPKSKVWSIEFPNRTVTGSGNHYKVSTAFIKKYYSGRPEGKVISVEGPAGTVTTIDGQALVQSEFLTSYYGNGKAHNVDEPCPTVTTKDRFSKIQPKFITNYYSSGGELSFIEKPSPSITNVPKQNLTSWNFIDQQYGNSKPSSLDDPSNSITVNPKFNLVQAKPWLMDTNFNNIGSSVDEPSRTIVAARKHHYLMNPQFSSNGNSIDKPCFTLIARMDKAPPYLIGAETGNLAIIIYEDDNETMIKIKEFMALYGIIDIKMRMLLVQELKEIQGFPKDYILNGTKTDQKKFIGNAVEVNQAKALVEANYNSLNQFKTAI